MHFARSILVAFYALLAAVVPSVVFGATLGLWHKLDETSGITAADSSGNANNGTLTGGPTLGAAAPRHLGVYFAADGQYVTAPASTTLNALGVSNADFSVSFWVKPNGVSGNWRTLLHKGAGQFERGPGLWLNPGNNRVHFRVSTTANNNEGTDSVADLPNGSWSHIACVKAGNKWRCYINGVLDTEITLSGGTTGNNGPLLVGDDPWYYGSQAWIDDVRLYDGALTDAAVKSLYDGLVGHWKFEETTGNTASDSSGAGNQGTFINAPTLGQTGVYDLATRFNGVALTEYVSLPRAAIHQAFTVSVSFWVKTTYTGEQAILSGNNASQDNEFLMHFGSSTEFRVYCHGNTQSWTISSIADGNWHHFAVVSRADTNTTTVYKDGALVGSRTISANATPFSIAVGGLIVAQEQDSVGGSFLSSQCLRGTLDDLRLYNRALSTREIFELFGLSGRWAFSEGAGSTVTDISGVASNATISGASWTSDCGGNTALDFDGINDAAATSAAFDPPNEGAVSLWFRSAGTPASRQRLWGLNGDFEMWQDPDGLISCDVATDGFQGGCITTIPLDTADEWYHLVVHFDADTDAYSIYINGELHKIGVSSWGTSNQPAGILTFGTRTGTAEYFEGSIRDFRVYNRPMFASEIAAASGIIARWQLNESSGTAAADSSIAGNNATYVGSPTLGAAGSNTANNNAVELNGTNQYVTSGKSLLNGLTKFSMMAWVRADNITPDKSFFGQTGLIELGIDTSSNQLDLWTSSGGSLSANTQLPISKWSHVAAIGDGFGLKIYVNGIEVAAGGSVTATYGSNSGIFKIGEGVLTASGNYFDGRFDDVRVYSRALCPSEIAAIYQGGRPAGLRIIQWVETR